MKHRHNICALFIAFSRRHCCKLGVMNATRRHALHPFSALKASPLCTSSHKTQKMNPFSLTKKSLFVRALPWLTAASEPPGSHCLLQRERCVTAGRTLQDAAVDEDRLNGMHQVLKLHLKHWRRHAMSTGHDSLQKGQQILNICKQGPRSQYVALFEGSQVRLHSMSAEILNGALCEVVEDCISQDRVAVRVLAPHEAVAAHPNGVKIKRSNITPVLPSEDQMQEWEQLASFDSSTRLGICGAIVDDFISACMQDCYPLEDQERIFGVIMHNSTSSLSIQHKPTGNIVYLCWLEHIKSQEATRHSILHAIFSRRLPEYFEELVRNADGSLYAAELVRRGFSDIEWDRNFLRFICG
jgi:hypothetical protein